MDAASASFNASAALPVVPSSPLDEALGVLFTLGASALHARRCSLYLRGDDGATLELRGQRGLSIADAQHIPADGTITGLVMNKRISLLVKNVVAHPVLPTHPDRYVTPSFLSVPVLVENDARGVLNAADRLDGEPFSEDDLQSAEMVARSMAAVLHSDLLARRARGEGEVDPVTGLYDARHLQKRLAQEVERAEQDSASFTLLLIEVGCYGDLATRIGMQAAGVLVRCVGEMVAQTVRQSDVLARRSDDEIAVLLPSTPLDKARRTARAIMHDVTLDRLPTHLRYDIENVGICIGVAAYVAGMDAEGMIRQASAALSQARAQGETLALAGVDDGGDAPAVMVTQAVHQQAIATALRLGIPYLADPAAAATAPAVRLLSIEMARTYVCFPIAFEGGTLTLAMADPTDASAIQAVAHATNMAVYPVASPREKILQAIATLMRPGAPRLGNRIRMHVSATPNVARFRQQLDGLMQRIAAAEIPDLTVEATLSLGVRSRGRRDDLTGLLAGLSADTGLRPDAADHTLWRLPDSEWKQAGTV